jgi:hypothetical protein
VLERLGHFMQGNRLTNILESRINGMGQQMHGHGLPVTGDYERLAPVLQQILGALSDPFRIHTGRLAQILQACERRL